MQCAEGGHKVVDECICLESFNLTGVDVVSPLILLSI